jgi:hypothetical protein
VGWASHFQLWAKPKRPGPLGLLGLKSATG